MESQHYKTRIIYILVPLFHRTHLLFLGSTFLNDVTLRCNEYGVEPITTFIRSGRLRWYGHVMRKGDEDWVKKCIEYRVEGRRPVGRPRKTWLESVEVDMAELEIDKEDVHDRSKWRRIVNVMKRKSNPIGKRTINR